MSECQVIGKSLLELQFAFISYIKFTQPIIAGCIYSLSSNKSCNITLTNYICKLLLIPIFKILHQIKSVQN